MGYGTDLGYPIYIYGIAAVLASSVGGRVTHHRSGYGTALTPARFSSRSLRIRCRLHDRQEEEKRVSTSTESILPGR